MSGTCLVIGGKLQGIRVALDLADAGQQVTVIEEGRSIGLDPGEGEGAFTGGLSRQDVVPMVLRAISHPNIRTLTGSRLIELKGEAGEFRARVSRLPGYIREELCKGCGVCVDACPVTLDSDRVETGWRRKAIDFDSALAVPFVPNIAKERRAPCVEACPAHINIQGYVALVSKGRFKEAYELIRETIPFPSICGRVCFHPCEFKCSRLQVDEPIAINNIKRFVSDFVHREGLIASPEPLNPQGFPVAVIGSGPAGLTAAHDLIRMGYRVTVFEALPEPGGMLRVGIVSYRLPRDILDREIRDLERLGVEIVTGCRVGHDLTIEGLFARGYEAVFVSTGAHLAKKLRIEGEDLPDVVDGVTFLREVNLKGKFRLGKEVIVIGGGNVALDCARTALRVGAETVKVVCLESRKEMPSHSWEIEEALEEGIVLMPSLGPKRIITRERCVAGLETLKVKHVFDEEGRFNPAFHEGTEGTVEGDSIIVAIGQAADKSFLQGADGVELDGRGALKIDRQTLMTTRPGLFAGGDLTTGPLSVIDAIASGKRAAISIDRYLRKERGDFPEWTPVRGGHEDPFSVVPGIEKSARVKPERLQPEGRARDFAEVEKTITAEMAMAEAARCLSCGSCSECMECVRVCEILRAVDHEQEVEDIEIRAERVVVAVDEREGEFAALLGLETDRNGLPLLPGKWQGSLETSRSGLYLPGWDGGEKDFRRDMIRASSVSSEILTGTGPSRPVSPVESRLPERTVGRPSRIGAFVCRCGGGISDYVDCGQVAEGLGRSGPVVVSEVIDYACSAAGIERMRAGIREKGLDAVVLAACSCCSLEQICSNCSHQRVRQKEEVLGTLGLDPKVIELVNIREHCAWIHTGDRAGASGKAYRIARAGLDNLIARDLADGQGIREIGKEVAVIGDGLTARSCATTLALLDFHPVMLATGRARGMSEEDSDLRPSGGVEVEDVTAIRGGIGDYLVHYTAGGVAGEVRSDFVVLAIDGLPPSAISIDEPGARQPIRFSLLEPFASRRRGFIHFSGSGREDESWKRMIGRALAMRVLAERGSGSLPETSWAPQVDPFWCRGCGTCVEVCPFEACAMVEGENGRTISRVDPLSCRGCELCVLHCPTGAMRSGYFDDRSADRLLEALLTAPEGETKAGKKIVIFACHWCHYGGTDIRGRGLSDYPAGVKVLRLTCTGRIGPGLILKAFQHGADGVMIMGCPDGECHYLDGNRSYQRDEGVVRELMQTIGIPASRYRTLWTHPGQDGAFRRGIEAFMEALGEGVS